MLRRYKYLQIFLKIYLFKQFEYNHWFSSCLHILLGVCPINIANKKRDAKGTQIWQHSMFL